MRRLIKILAVLFLLLPNTGCLVNMWSSDPNTRMEQLIFASEDLRQIEGFWYRFWMIDQPSHLTPIRVHGGISPGGGSLP